MGGNFDDSIADNSLSTTWPYPRISTINWVYNELLCFLGGDQEQSLCMFFSIIFTKKI